ncbi:DNA repair protein, partial [Phytophthora megakarya]
MASEDEEFAYSAGELDDEEEDGVDWEDVSTSQQIPDSPPVSLDVSKSLSEPQDSASNIDDKPAEEDEKIAEPAQNLQQIDWEQVNRSLAEQDAASVTRKRRRTPIRLTKDEKQREKALHQTHLLVLLAARVKWSKLSRSQLLQGLLLSLTAASDVDFFADMKQQPLAYSLELLIRWFNQEFRLTEDGELRGEVMTEASLMDVFFAREGRDFEL